MQGAPGEIQDSDAGALENIASKKIGGFKKQPSLVFVERSKEQDEPVPAFWHKQLSWNNDTYRSRFGHRYLSVHFVKQGENKYEKFEESLEPQITNWLDAYKETVSGQREHYPIEKIIFGYINLFRFSGDDFDLSQYFKVNFGTDVSYAEKGIGGLEITFSVSQPTHVMINIRVTPESPVSDDVVVTTRVEAHKVIEDECSFENDEKIMEIIGDMKESAKSVFFDLATDETHQIMGARYAQSTTQ